MAGRISVRGRLHANHLFKYNAKFESGYKMTARRFTLCLLTMVLLINCANAQEANNWPQWRGSTLDSVSQATNLPVNFEEEGSLLWRVELPGPAGASPIVWGDRVLLTSVDSESGELLLLCYNMAGEQLWQRQLKGENQKVRMDSSNSASPSPSTDGKHVWANTGVGFLECFDMDGNPVWSVDLQDRYGDFDIQFGMTSTPILHGGRLYLQLIHGSMRGPGTSVGYVVALNAETGEEIWMHTRKTDGTAENRHSYASPTIVHEGEDAYLVTHGGDYVMGHSLEDGSEIWRCGGFNPQGDGYNPYLRFVSSPIFSDGMLLVPTAKNRSIVALKPSLVGDVTQDDSARYWTLDRGTPDVACPVTDGRLVYLAGEKGVFTALDAVTGEVVYKKRLMADRHRSTPVVADGKLYITGRDGTIHVLSQGRNLEVLAQNELGEQTTASPAIVDGMIFIRTWEALYCFAKE